MTTATRTKLSRLASKVKIELRYGAALVYDKQDEWQQQANSWRVTLICQRRRLTIDFWQGHGISRDPDAAGVLSCLLSESLRAFVS